MKRFSAIILSAVMAFFVCACGGGAKPAETTVEETTVAEESTAQEDNNQQDEEQLAEIGEKTVSASGNFEMTLKNVSIADRVNLDINSDDFCKPLKEGEESENALIGKDVETFITFEFEYKFIGKSAQKDHFLDYGEPRVVYDDGYTFNEKYMVFSKTDDKEWLFFATDTSKETRAFYKLGNVIFVNNNYKPLEDTIHYGVGVIDVPSKIKEDIEAPLKLQFPALGGVYRIR